jgi:hypothetical protein
MSNPVLGQEEVKGTVEENGTGPFQWVVDRNNGDEVF